MDNLASEHDDPTEVLFSDLYIVSGCPQGTPRKDPPSLHPWQGGE